MNRLGGVRGYGVRGMSVVAGLMIGGRIGGMEREEQNLQNLTKRLRGFVAREKKNLNQ
jgi:hypothetical protein